MSMSSTKQLYMSIVFLSGICITLFRIMNMKGIYNCCFHPAAKEIIERGHHISVYRVHVKLPCICPLLRYKRWEIHLWYNFNTLNFLLNIVHQFISVESNWCWLFSGYDAESVSNNNLNCIMCVKFALITFSPWIYSSCVPFALRLNIFIFPMHWITKIYIVKKNI